MTHRKYVSGLAAVLLIAAVLPYSLSAQNPPPAPFSKYLVYTAAGVYDPNVPPAEGDLAIWFHKTIMGRSDAEIAAEKARAEQYFLETFGIPLGTSVAFGLDPRNEYRAYFISGENVPPIGWVVRDGGFIFRVGPGGMMFFGSWGGPGGKWVPEGTIVVFGDYNIAVTSAGRGSGDDARVRRTILIHYESTTPIVPNPVLEGIFFQCTLRSAEFGTGLAQGVSIPQMRNGKVVANIRNILTFPGLGFAAQ